MPTTPAVKKMKKRMRYGEEVDAAMYWLPVQLKKELDREARKAGRSSTEHIILILEKHFEDR